jgi:hypothetical protein
MTCLKTTESCRQVYANSAKRCCLGDIAILPETIIENDKNE